MQNEKGMTITLSKVQSLLKYYLKAQLVPFLISSPGVGKSSIVKEFAQQHSLKCIDLRVSQLLPEDLNGFPIVDKEQKKASYAPFDVFPVEGDILPDGYKGWILFLDELNAANEQVLAALYKIILDRQIGQKNLHSSVYIIAAGNYIEDGALVNDIGTALRSRMAELFVEADPQDTIQYLINKGYPEILTTFLSYTVMLGDENVFSTFNQRETATTFACPRTWEMLGKLLNSIGDFTHDNLNILVQSCVGQNAAASFMSYYCLIQYLPTYKELISNPDSAVLPTFLGEKFLLCRTLVASFEINDIDAICTILQRIENKEIHLIFWKMLLHKNPTAASYPSVQKAFGTVLSEIGYGEE